MKLEFHIPTTDPPKFSTIVLVWLILLSSLYFAKASPGTSPLKLSLREAVRLGVRHNLQVKAASYGPKVAQQELISAQGKFDPVITWTIGKSGFTAGLAPIIGNQHDVDGSIAWQHQTSSGITYSLQYSYLGSKLNLGPGGESFTKKGDTVLTLTYPLLKGAGPEVNRAEIYIATKRQNIELATFKRRLLDTAAGIEQSYWELVRARSLYKTRLKALARSQEFLNLLKAGISSGAIAPYEAYEAEQNVATRQAQATAAKRDIYVAEQNLLRLLNLDLRRDLSLTPTTSPALPKEQNLPLNQPLNKLLDEAFRNRPELPEKALQVEITTRRLKVADNNLFPALDLIGEYKLSTMSNELYRWRVGLDFSFPLNNRNASGEYEKTKLLLKKHILELEDTRQGIILEVTRALRKVQENSKRVRFLHRARLEAEKRLEAELERFRAGLGTAHLVNFAEQQLNGMEQLEVDGLIDYQISLVNLRRALGTTLSHYDIKIKSSADNIIKDSLPQQGIH